MIFDGERLKTIMLREFNFSLTSKLFLLRSDENRYNFENSGDDLEHFEKIPKFDKNQLKLTKKIKNFDDISRFFAEIGFSYEYEPKIFDFLLLHKTDKNAVIAMFQIFIFVYRWIQNLEEFKQENYLKFIEILIYFVPRPPLKADVLYQTVYDFVYNLIFCCAMKTLWFFDIKCIEKTVSFYSENKNMSNIYIDRFLYFINFVSQNILEIQKKSPDNSTSNIESDILKLLFNMYYEQRNLILSNIQKQILNYICPMCTEFNKDGLNIFVIISQTINNPLQYSQKIIDGMLENFYSDLHKIEINYNPSQIIYQYNPKLPLVYNFNYVETESKFIKGFINPVNQWGENSITETEFVLQNLEKSLKDKVIILSDIFQKLESSITLKFLSNIKHKIDNYESSIHSDQSDKKNCLMILFLVFLRSISECSFISSFSDIFFNEFIFNPGITIFDTNPIDNIIDSMRSIVFSLIINNKEAVYAFISNISNILLLAEVISRIKDIYIFLEPKFIDIVFQVSLQLQEIDIANHSKQIEKARSSVFLVFADLIQKIPNSSKYFEKVLLFCFEKNLTTQFLDLFSKTFDISNDSDDLDQVCNFIKAPIKTSDLNQKNIDVCWLLVETVVKKINKYIFVTEITLRIFDLLIEFLVKAPTIPALSYALNIVSYYKQVDSRQLKILCNCLKLFINDDLYSKLLTFLGKSEVCLPKQEGFLIKKPIFIPILVFTFGFNSTILRLFQVLCRFSLYNIKLFHDYKVDYIILQFFRNIDFSKHKFEINSSCSAVIDYYGDNFQINISDINKAHELLDSIVLMHTDFSIVSHYLNNSILLKHINLLSSNLLSQPFPSIPYGSFGSSCSSNRLRSSMFQDKFSVSFWLKSDNFLMKENNTTCNLITFTDKTKKLCIWLKKSTLSASVSNGRTKTNVVLQQNISSNLKWTFFYIVFDNNLLLIDTFINNIPSNQSEFTKIDFDEKTTITCILGGTPTQNRNHQICGYISSFSFYNRRLEEKEINNILSSFHSSVKGCIISTLNKDDFSFEYPYSLTKKINLEYNDSFSNFSPKTYVNENLFSVLCYNKTVEYILYLLNKEETEENIYQYLFLLEKISSFIYIDWKYIYYFVIQKQNFHFTKIFFCVYSIFKKLDKNPQNQKNETLKSSQIKLFGSNIFGQSNQNEMSDDNKDTSDINKQKWFDLLINFDIWKNYSNFKTILHFWANTLIFEFSHYFYSKPYFSYFIQLFNTNDSFSILDKYWDLSLLFIKRVACFSATYYGISVIFNLINSYKNGIILMQPFSSSNKLPHILYSKEFKYSNIEVLNLANNSTIFQTSTKENNNYLFRPPQLLNNIELKIPSHLHEDNLRSSDKTSELTNAKVYNSSSHLHNSDNNENERLNDLLDLLAIVIKKIEYKDIYENSLLNLMTISNVDILCKCLTIIHTIFNQTNATKLTVKLLQVIDPSFYEEILSRLSLQIESYPYFFPLICALCVFSDVQNFNYLIPNIKSIQFKTEDETFFFFPILLSFLMVQKEYQQEIMNVIARSINDSKKCISLMCFISFLEDNFIFDNCKNTDLENAPLDIISLFAEAIKESNHFNKLADKLFLQILCSLLFEIYLDNPLKNPIVFDSIHCLYSFIQNINISNVKVKFMLKLDKNETILLKDRNNLSSDLMDYVKNNSLSENVIAKIVYRSISLRIKNNTSLQAFMELNDFIDKLSKFYFDQITECLHTFFNNLKKSIEFNSNIALLNTCSDFIQPSLNINVITTKQPILKSTYDRCYRQSTIVHKFKIKILCADFNSRQNQSLEKFNCILLKNNIRLNAYVKINNDMLVIKRASKSIKTIDLINLYGFERNKNEFEIFTKEGKSFYIIFVDNESCEMLKKIFYKKKIISKELSEKQFSRYEKQWMDYQISTFKFIMFLNIYLGYTPNSPTKKPCYPSYLFTACETESNTYSFISVESKSRGMHIYNPDVKTIFNSNDLHPQHLFDIFGYGQVPAYLYYLFEVIPENEPIPSSFAKDRFEFIYKIRKVIERVSNIESWVENTYGIKIRPRNSPPKNCLETNQKFIFSDESSIKYAHSIPNVENLFLFLMCTKNGNIYSYSGKKSQFLFDLHKYYINSQFFELIDGIIAYSYKDSKIIILNYKGNVEIIDNAYLNNPIFAGSTKKLIFTYVPTKIMVCKRDDKMNYHSSILCQLQSEIIGITVSFEFYIIAIATADRKITIVSLNNGEFIADFDLEGCIAESILITNSFGFIFIVTCKYLYLLTNNGTLIKKTPNEFSNNRKWYSFTTKTSLDYIFSIDSKTGEVGYFEAFNPLNVITYHSACDIITVSYNPLNESIFILEKTGKVFPICFQEFIE